MSIDDAVVSKTVEQERVRARSGGMMGTSYGWEQLREGMRILVSDGSVQQRVGRAWIGGVSKLQEDDLPAALRGKFRELRADMVDGHQSLEERASSMTADAAVAHARSLFVLFEEILRTHPPY